MSLPNESDMEAFTVTGGSNAIKNKLRDLVQWNGTTPWTALIHRIALDGSINSTNWILLGSIKPIVWPASSIWKGASPDLRVTIECSDLAMFEFHPPSNIS